MEEEGVEELVVQVVEVVQVLEEALEVWWA